MFLTKRQVDNGTVARLKIKKFDGDAARQVQQELERIVNEKPEFLIISFEEVEFITSYGISILLLLNKKLKSQGAILRLAALSQILKDSLLSAKIDNLIQIFNNVEDALPLE